MKFQPIHIRSGKPTGKPLTEAQKSAHEQDVHLKGKYRYEPIETPKTPSTAKKAEDKKEK